MYVRNGAPVTTRVLAPTGMLGGGFPEESIKRGIAMGAHVIAVDGGSTDSGPHYLGASKPKTTDEAVARDLRSLVLAGKAAGIPVIVGSCGTSGTDSGVDWIAHILRGIAREEGLSLRVASIKSELEVDLLVEYLAADRIHPLAPVGPLDIEALQRCQHVVGLMGHEPIADALDVGVDVVLAGRATDTALLAAVPLARGCPPGPTWHAAKVAECGGMCTTNPRSGGVLVEIDAEGFTIEPLMADAACTPHSVAAHMLYENADPFRMREPRGWLDTSEAVYEALDDRRVRVTGSQFVEAEQYTMKLEGAAIAGYQSMAIAGIREPEVLENIQTWHDTLMEFLDDGILRVLGLASTSYTLELRCYGWNAVLGGLDASAQVPREVGVTLVATAQDQATAHKIAKYANPYLLHMPLPSMTYLPCFAFMSSPAEFDKGAVYEFVLNHAVDIDTPTELVRTTMWDVA
jgi:hypothetical protein